MSKGQKGVFNRGRKKGPPYENPTGFAENLTQFFLL